MLLADLLHHLTAAITALHVPTATPPPGPAAPAPSLPAPSALSGLSDEDLLALAAADETIAITSDAPAESASSVYLDTGRLRTRPRTQPSDLLRQVPGLVVSQHAGGGKADQYFIRGFDADHGTDVAIFADGVPVNLTSHGHGQGYADSHFLIPETIASVAVHKGPYAARYGDYYTAGAIELTTLDQIDGPTVWVAGAAPIGEADTRYSNQDRRLVAMASPRLRRDHEDRSLLAVQVAENDGPFLHPQDFRQGNALGRWSGEVGPGRLSVAGTWYDGRWNQSGQLPAGEVAAGRLPRFGAIDPTEGGAAIRASIAAGYQVRDDEARSTWRVHGYGVRNQLDLFSNFTLYARDAVHGDQIGQRDDRVLVGASASYERAVTVGATEALLSAGAQLRFDAVTTSLRHTEARRDLATCFGADAGPCNHSRNRIGTVGIYAEADVVPTPRLHLRPGLRVDGFTWSVDDLAATAGDPDRTTAGRTRAAIVSPKLSAELHESDVMTFFAHVGTGFHSNDARAAVASDGQGALARAVGGELGLRMKPHPRARLAADVWTLALASEQVWSGDAGGTSPSDPTRRSGLDLDGSLAVTAWLDLDANVAWARAAVVANAGNGGALALAPRWMGSGGVSIHDTHRLLSLRARGLADRPGNEDGTLTAEGYLLLDLVGSWRRGDLTAELTITNLLDQRWREAQFAEASRVAPGADVIEQMHFTPGAPLTATARVAYTF